MQRRLGAEITPITPATQVEIRRIMIQGQPVPKLNKTPNFKKQKQQSRHGGIHLLSSYLEAISRKIMVGGQPEQK
jgi:hypothetical protein